MPSREELSEVLVECLKDVSSLLTHAHSIAMFEQQALVDNDADALVKSCKAQEDILRRIGETDQRAADAATQLAEMIGADPETADASTISAAVGAPYSGIIANHMSNIATLSEKVKNANEINRQLLQNGMDIITCCLRTLAADHGPTSYSKDAGLSSARPLVLSLDRRA